MIINAYHAFISGYGFIKHQLCFSWDSVESFVNNTKMKDGNAFYLFSKNIPRLLKFSLNIVLILKQVKYGNFG